LENIILGKPLAKLSVWDLSCGYVGGMGYNAHTQRLDRVYRPVFQHDFTVSYCHQDRMPYHFSDIKMV
jgi:hypothetical protein